MKKYIILICTAAGAVWFGNSYSSLDGWDWAIHIGFGAFFGWSVSTALLKSSGNSKKSTHNRKFVGTIKDIEYSTIRINNQPRLKISVAYAGVKKSFEPIDPSIQYSVSIGDEAVIYANPLDITDAHLDVTKTKLLKNHTPKTEK